METKRLKRGDVAFFQTLHGVIQGKVCAVFFGSCYLVHSLDRPCWTYGDSLWRFSDRDIAQG